MAIQLSNEDTDRVFNRLKSDMKARLDAGEAVDVGHAKMICDCIILAASSPTFASDLKNRSAAVFLDKKTHASEYEGAWRFFTELLALPARLTSEEEQSRFKRDKHNNKVSAAQSAIRNIACIFYAIGYHDVWKHFNVIGKVRDAVMLNNEGAMLLYPKRAEAMEESGHTAQRIAHRAGEYRFSSIADVGKTLLEGNGIKSKSTTMRAGPMRDAVEKAGNAIENADAKSFDVETRRKALSALVKMIDALNDQGVKDHLDSALVAPFRAHVVERFEKAERDATTPQKDVA